MSDMNSRDDFEYSIEDDNEFTLESILAEFKGSAYIAGDRKTSPDLLDERIRRIVDEAKKGGIADTELYNLKDDSNGDFFADIHDTESELEEDTAKTAEEIKELSPEDKKLAAKTAEIDWQPVKAATSFDEARREMQAFFAKRDEAVKRQEEELLRKRQDEMRLREEEGRKREEALKKAGAVENAQPADTVIGGSTKKALQAGAESDWRDTEFDADITAENAHDTEDNGHSGADITDDSDEPEILIFDNYRFADSDDSITAAEKRDYSTQEEPEEEYIEKKHFLSWLFRKKRKLADTDTETLEAESDSYIDGEDRLKSGGPEQVPVFEPEMEPEVYIEEPDFAWEAQSLGKRCRKMMVKSRIALFMSLIMGLITLLFERGARLPLIGTELKTLTAVLVIMQLVVMLMSIDVLRRGFKELIKREPGAETLVLFSNMITYLSCCWYIYTGNDSMGVPFCAVAAFSAAFSEWGEYRVLGAMSLSLKTAVSTSSPKGLSCEYIKDMDRTIIKRHPEGQAGFYNNLVEADVSELTYRYFAPFIIFAAVLLSVVSAIGSECAFIHCFSAVAASCAAFNALSAFSAPFSIAAKKLRRGGSAIAGWGGADDIFYADGVRITDSDLFPGGAAVGGVKVFDGVKADKVIRYTSSLMIATDSDLAPAFTEFINKQGLAMAKIEGFDCTEGGVCAVIRGERVICGTSACMALFGIRVPQELNIKNAMYTAINDTLAGAFTISYTPSRMVQSSLLTMLRAKVKLYFAMRDFNITPLMVQQKLQIPVDDIEYLPTHASYELSEDKSESVPHSDAVLARDIPVTFADTVATAKRLRQVTLVNTAISVLTTLLGMVIMFFMCWKGNSQSVSPANLMEYMFAMEIVVLIVSRAVNMV